MAVATYGFGTVTGGEGGATYRVTNATDFLSRAQSTSAAIIEVSGTITLAAGMHSIQSNKTIIGVGTTAKITGGGLYFTNKTNVIIKNITFTGANDDCIGIDNNSNNFLIDHCDFSNANDGLIDIYRGSTNITVSWCKFHDHTLTGLVGHDDAQTSDRGKLKVTFHHNWYDGVDQRQPRVRYGEVHVYNNYYRGNNSLYALGVGVEAKIYSENNYFENIPATLKLDTAGQPGYAKDVGSYFVGTQSKTFYPSGVTWSPSDYYIYPLDSAVNVKSVVMAGAGIVTETAPVEEENQLTGKTLLNFGDSIAAGSGNNFNGYAHLLATKVGMTLTSKANGGATAGVKEGSTNNIIEQINSVLGQAADYILFNGLTNDISNTGNIPLGTVSSGFSATLDTSTFCGGFEQICKLLTTNWATAKIVYVRPHKMGITSRDPQKQIDYGNKALEMCEKWGIPYVDIYTNTTFDTSDSTTRTTYTNNGDGTHPNESGYNTFYVPLIEAEMKITEVPVIPPEEEPQSQREPTIPPMPTEGFIFGSEFYFTDRKGYPRKLSDVSSLTKWSGKNVLAIGENLTSDLKWQNTVISLLGCHIQTHAIGGGLHFHHMVNGATTGSGTLPPLSTNHVADKDLIIVFGGLQERDKAYGVLGDIYPTQDTIYGRVQYVINKLYNLLQQANNLRCKILFVTPHCVGKYSYIDVDGYGEYPAGSGRNLEGIVSAIKGCANSNNIRTVDLWHNSGIGRNNWSIYTQSPTATITPPDGSTAPFPSNGNQVLLNDTGYNLVGEIIAGEMNLM